MEKLSVKDVDVRGRRVLVRVDYNVPIKEGKVADDTRIQASLPTINYLLNNEAKVILMTHLGRPKGVEDSLRLDPVAKRLSALLNRAVKKVNETVCSNPTAEARKLKPGEILLLENLRFNPGEKENDLKFCQKLAKLADIYVNDAFGTAHRAHASTFGVPKIMPTAVAGLLLEKELKNLDYLLRQPERPFYTVLGGSKVSDKIDVIDKFLDIVDALFTGGGMLFTFLKAQGFEVGNSLVEEEQIEHAKVMLEKAKSRNVDFYLPTDVVITKQSELLKDSREHKVVSVNEIPTNWMGVDIGPESAKLYAEKLSAAKTIFWNGPMGIFEIEEFSYGTEAVAKAIANSFATTIVGGGDSDRALRKYNLEEKISFVSTGGGASLKVLEGTKLPGVEVLQDKEAYYEKASQI
jgi:phosphoglycerate kinase